MDGRIALTRGKRLAFHNHEGGLVCYTIRGEIGRGGSSIVYDASYTDNLGNPRLVRVKECCPHDLRLTRREDGALEARAGEAEAFEAKKRRMVEAYRRNHELFSIAPLTNHVVNTSDIYEGNGTVYIVSTYANSETLAEHRCESLGECVALALSTARVLERIHGAGYLYLDLKPENILILRGSTGLVQLFDFDSMLSMAALERAVAGGEIADIRASYTRGFAPLEQQTGKLRRLGPHSDVFSLGAVLFYMLWGRVPAAFDCEEGAVYDYGRMAFSGAACQDRLFRELTAFFRRALASYTGDRYAAMSEAVEQLALVARLSDDTRPWLRSTPVSAPAFFTGREAELSALADLLRQPGQRVFSLCGVGGIGKSALVRAYLSRSGSEYDAILFLYDGGSAGELLLNDALVFVNTVERQREESAREYLLRKTAALQRLCEKQRVLVALDNFRPERLKAMEPILDMGWQVLLISRTALPDGLFPSMRIGALSGPEQAGLFARYSHCALEDEADASAFLSIARSVGGHTLMLELIARQIAGEYLSLPEAAALAERYGFSHIAGGRVDYVRNRQGVRDTLENVLGQLLERDRHTGLEKRMMKLLSLFDAPGVPASLFRELAGLSDMEPVRALERGGWLSAERNVLSLHPVMREYVQGWLWHGGEEDLLPSAEALLERLCERIQPVDRARDSDKQFPEDYRRLDALLRLAEQALTNLGATTPAGQRLRFRLLMDAPVDRDEDVLRQTLALLRKPDYLDDASVLRLYDQAALLYRRLGRFDDAFDMMKAMRGFLARHPNAFYLSVYHNTMANMLHDADAGANLSRCLRHQDGAIAAARLSGHRDARRQLATCLLDKAMTLLDLNRDARQCGRLLDEAAGVIEACCGEYDYERYHLLCIDAMYRARVTGEYDEALALLGEATRVADVARDSPMSYADHLLDECVPIYYEMGRIDDALRAIDEAVQICDGRKALNPYRRLRREALGLREHILNSAGRER